MAVNPVVETALGKVRGKLVTSHLGDDYYSFQGIPYAKAPVGNLRFKVSAYISFSSIGMDGTFESM